MSLAYTHGVAAPCLEIQKEPAKGYERTSRANNILVLTDSSKHNSENKCCLKKNLLKEKIGIIMLLWFICKLLEHIINVLQM